MSTTICSYCHLFVNPDEVLAVSTKNRTLFYHPICKEELDRKLTTFNNFVDKAERITEANLELDVKKMREDGILNNPEDYSDENFFQCIEQRMIESNAEKLTISLELTYKNQPTGNTIHFITIYKNNRFNYIYRKSAFKYLKNGFSGYKYIKALCLYLTNRSFRLMVQKHIRELIWRCSPDPTKMQT